MVRKEILDKILDKTSSTPAGRSESKPEPKPLASVKQIAAEYGIRLWDLHQKIRSNQVPRGVVIRFGPRRIFINRERWAEWLDAGGSAGEV